MIFNQILHGIAVFDRLLPVLGKAGNGLADKSDHDNLYGNQERYLCQSCDQNRKILRLVENADPQGVQQEAEDELIDSDGA